MTDEISDYIDFRFFWRNGVCSEVAGQEKVLTSKSGVAFFRWMSERYPFVLKLVEQNRIPQFDNLYLDMNGIIHNCSHPNEEDAHFRITEEQIFLAIFAYLEHLFALVKPQKLFFMAVDGVAPRAKMNQQRSRRFRTAKDRKDMIDKAERKGETLPSTEAFDSNCITPGTPFMARLSEQLKYFINQKVSTDSAWHGVQVVFSGHDVPGEGEHKIMEYIRLAKAQPDYNPNVRHCLYGLDADLIMLALLSHDPHFCLLREEVKFGPARKQGHKGLEEQAFYLLHISLVREYLDLEFASLRTVDDAGSGRTFQYDLERIIDDFILLCIFVGNDFLPHLPGLHINEGALGLLFEIYKKVVPVAGGYLNESGKLNTQRLQMILNELTSREREEFEHEFADATWFKGKQASHVEQAKSSRKNSQFVLSPQQRNLFTAIDQFIVAYWNHPTPETSTISFPANYPAKDRRFLADLADALNLAISFDEYNDEDEPIIVLSIQSDGEDDSSTNEIADMLENTTLVDGSEHAESRIAAERVLYKYREAPTVKDLTTEEVEARQEDIHNEKIKQWKSEYYSQKMNIDLSDPGQLEKLAYTYVEGLQWVLHYYYDGVASWSWFYPYHYSPKISDLRHVDTYQFDFALGQPFKPFEQLMGVLPSLSSAHVPPVFRDLMTNPESPIIDLYPQDFETDMNGKKQDWEAVVKIPFIDQERLLKAMRGHENRLTEEERKRNTFGTSWLFEHDPDISTTYPSSLPGFFADLHNCRSKMTPYDLPTLGGLRFIKGLCEGVLLGKDAIAGFPSLHNLPHYGTLSFHGITIYQTASRKETIIVHIENLFEGLKVEDIGRSLIGNRVYIDYPFLREAKVVAISDSLFRYELDTESSQLCPTPHTDANLASYRRTVDRLEYNYSKKCGLITGEIEVLLHVKPIKTLTRAEDGALIKEYEEREVEHALQTVVTTVSSEDPRFLERPACPIEEEFPEDCPVFFLGTLQYGSTGSIVGHAGGSLAIRIMYFPDERQENLAFKSALRSHHSENYLPSHVVSKRLGIRALSLSKITSSLMLLESPTSDNKVNIGLNLKFEAKALKVLGYSRKTENGWEYSTKAIELLGEYNSLFPEIARTLDSHANEDLSRAEVFFPHDAEKRMTEMKAWLKEKNVKGFERVSLYAEMLDSNSIAQLEGLAARYKDTKVPERMKQAIIRNIPRRAVLKPAHASERLQGQMFEVGDRVVLATDSGAVPLSAKGTVVGLSDRLIDVVFDAPFIGGTNLSNKCSAYRGASISPASLLNLTSPQYAHSIVATRSPTAISPPVGPSYRNGLQFAQGRRVQPALVPRQTHEPNAYQPAAHRGSRGSTRPAFSQASRVATHVTRSVHQAATGPGPLLDVLQTNNATQSMTRGSAWRGRGVNPTNGPSRSSYHAVPPPRILASRRGGPPRGRGQHASSVVQHPPTGLIPASVEARSNDTTTARPVRGVYTASRARGTRGRRGSAT
ncbi:XRN 5'-3' exonuclease N-terminus-domain-containing protein [Melampsora americana]|nr:XRN 5'-3' exonuclease N-terminus-domain-containing protein [Melampsora americana]